MESIKVFFYDPRPMSGSQELLAAQNAQAREPADTVPLEFKARCWRRGKVILCTWLPKSMCEAAWTTRPGHCNQSGMVFGPVSEAAMACFQGVLTKVKGMRPHPLLIILQAGLDAVHLLRELQECAASANHNALLNSGLQGKRACQSAYCTPAARSFLLLAALQDSHTSAAMW